MNNPFLSIKKYIKKERFEIGREVVISILISALISSAVGYYFNKRIDDRIASRQLIYEFSRTFFDNPKYRNISIALEEQYLYERGLIFKANGGQFTDYEIDDYLNFLYDLYSYGEENLVSYELIDNQFSYYVCIAYQNWEIKAYKQRLIAEGFGDDTATGYLHGFAKRLNIAENSDCKTL